MEKRICEYRNCNKDISEMRKDAKYCSRNCKTCERKYSKREDNKINKQREHIKNLLIQTQQQTISPEVIALFNLINKRP
jgi:hypothetical protein